jgi:transcriptional regulator with XRE-family HTH domain
MFIGGESNDTHRGDAVHDNDPNPDDIDDRAYFGWALTIVRERAGLTVRDVAKTAGIPVATAGDYFSGRSLPPVKMAGVLPDILRACGVDTPDLLDGWKSALIRVRLSRGRRADHMPAPYRGLAAYQSSNARWFYGRTRYVRTVLARCALARDSGVPVVLVGESGVGKTSLLAAGLVPALDNQPGSRTVTIGAGRNPCRQLADQLGNVLELPADVIDHALHVRPSELGRLLSEGPPLRTANLTVLVDGLEDLFATEGNRTSRNTFLSALTVLGAAGVAVVLCIRADRQAAVAAHPLLRQAVADPVVLGNPTDTDLVDIVQSPARKARLGVETGLVRQILVDTASVTADPLPGGPFTPLPLVSHALLMTWRRRRGGLLTLPDYQAVGGVRDAVRRSAELALASLNADQQQLAMTLFRRLTAFDETGMHGIGPVRRADLGCEPGNARRGQIEQVLGRFAAVGLVTIGPDTVEVTHDALFAAWPRVVDLVMARRA